MSKYLFLCFLVNFDIFFIPLSYFIYSYLKIKDKEGADTYSLLSFLECIFAFLCFSLIFTVSYPIYVFCSQTIEFLYRIRTPIILITFFAVFIVLLIICFRLSHRINHSYITINEKRQENVEQKLSLVHQYLKYFNRELDETRSSNKERIASIKNTIKLLEKIRDELEIIYTALDINIVSESFKDIELASDSLNEIQKEIDKMQAYRSLSDISSDLEELMKKYDKK